MIGSTGKALAVVSLLVVGLYLPTLRTPFDFIDDGNLVYAAPAGTTNYVSLWWEKVVANYEHLGPFRPTLWIHWELFANLFQGSPLLWRTERLIWCGLSAGMMMWWLCEMKINRLAAAIATLAAMANPYRNEIWTSLTLAEGVAMPYAMLALIAARKGALSPRAWLWDLTALFGLVMALGCKNVFVALIPAMVVLRTWPDDQPLMPSIRRNGWRAALLATPTILVVAHIIYFKMHWHEGQYEMHSASLTQAVQYLKCLKGAMSFDFMAAGMVVAAIICLLPPRPAFRITPAFTAAIALVLSGIVVYLPMTMISGRYSMPAVWGLDLLFALLLSHLLSRPSRFQVRFALLVLIVGLIATVVASRGRQEKFTARAQLLTKTLERIEATAPQNAVIAWVSGDSLADELDREEGIHFFWHLHARGRTDLKVMLLDREGKIIPRVELPPIDPSVTPTIRITSHAEKLEGWSPPEGTEVTYWFGKKTFACWTSNKLEKTTLTRLP
ncbi:MAG: hypothetical protein U0798_16280 [Gemmataceae bacterium]